MSNPVCDKCGYASHVRLVGTFTNWGGNGQHWACQYCLNNWTTNGIYDDDEERRTDPAPTSAILPPAATHCHRCGREGDRSSYCERLMCKVCGVWVDEVA